MSSLVLDLQKELMNKNCNILQALRHAHVIAVKLGLDEFDKWIQCELNGYLPDNAVPKYRYMTGVLKAKNPYLGWIPAVITDQANRQPYNTVPVCESMSGLIEIRNQCTDGTFCYTFPASVTMEMMKKSNSPVYMEISLFISVHNISAVEDKVKNNLLQWTLELEKKGILGENMIFNKKEEISAKEIAPYTINVYGTYVNGDVTHSQLVSGNNNSAAYNGTDIKAAMEEIRASLKKEDISEENMECILEILDDISSKINQKKKPGIIKAALTGLKDFVLAAGANITATLITAKIQGLF